MAPTDSISKEQRYPMAILDPEGQPAISASDPDWSRERKAAGAPLPWPEVVQGFTAPVPASRIAPRRECR